MNEDEKAVRSLESEIIEGWNSRNAALMTRSWAQDVTMVGFDGSQENGRVNAARTLSKIFADHEVARYVCLVRGVRQIVPGVAVLQAHVGMVPPGKDKIVPDRNSVQTLIAVARDSGWQTEVFQNTPAKWDGREAAVEALTRELQAAYDSQKALS